MDGLIYSVIGKYLTYYIKGLRKDQVNLNFVKGKGELTDIEVNARAVNDLLQLPNLQFTKICVNRLRVKASLRKLKTKPIVVYADRVTCHMAEPLDIAAVSAQLRYIVFLACIFFILTSGSVVLTFQRKAENTISLLE